jgi:NSS family neurotransmitter:Na+ symporter
MSETGDTGSRRGRWASKTGFVLAAAGSAVGLGNVWRFPYITGENGGGLFVLIYLACILAVGLPIMIGEILVGRAAQRSAVGAFKELAGPRTPWQALGGLGVFVAYLVLSFYSVVAGWTLHYATLSARGLLTAEGPSEIQALFDAVNASVPLNLGWTAVFLALTVAVVWKGVRKGLERWSRILMPALLVLLLILLVRAMAMDGFGKAFSFVFGLHAESLTGGGVIEALGHSFFTLSLGMCGLLTLGSYLRKDADVPMMSAGIAALDTLIALIACLVIFPITFSFGLEVTQGPGLIFATVPIAFAQMPGGGLLATLFFTLLVFAALTSAISLLEVAAAYFIDEKGWSRSAATLTSGLLVAALAIPSALTGGTELFGSRLEELTGSNWFDLIADIASNWSLPIGGMGIALFVAWRLPDALRRTEFVRGSRLGRYYLGWLMTLRFVVPLAIIAVFLRAVGVF